MQNSAGNLSNGYCGSWYQFHLKVDGTVVASGCAADLDGTVISTTFTTIEVYSEDLDSWSDDVTVTFDLEVTFTPPSCPSPTAFSASNITTSGADFGWTPGGQEQLWDLYIVASGGTTPDAASTPTMNDIGNPSTWSGGSPATAYDAYVRADCGGDLSDWVGPVSFTTLCAVKTPDYTEDFSSFVPNCWDEASNGDPTSGPMDIGSGDWLAEEFAHASTSGLGAVNVNLYNIRYFRLGAFSTF